MKLYLIGYMASGKSRIGKILAEHTGYDFLDLDEQFEARYRISVLDFFSKYGEALFRELEHKLLLETESLDKTIISTGGGAPCFHDNLSLILQYGTSVYLRMPAQELARRIEKTRKKRPLLYRVEAGNLLTTIQHHLQEREFFYRQANYIVDGPEYPLTKLLELIQGNHDGPRVDPDAG